MAALKVVSQYTISHVKIVYRDINLSIRLNVKKQIRIIHSHKYVNINCKKSCYYPNGIINLHKSHISFLPPVETDLGSDDDVVGDTFIIFVKLYRFPVSLSNKNTQLLCQFILLEFLSHLCNSVFAVSLSISDYYAPGKDLSKGPTFDLLLIWTFDKCQ